MQEMVSCAWSKKPPSPIEIDSLTNASSATHFVEWQYQAENFDTLHVLLAQNLQQDVQLFSRAVACNALGEDVQPY